MKICHTNGCERNAIGNSKYCREHRDIARAVWLNRVREEEEERAHRYLRFERAARAAREAGIAAAEACVPEPMIVVEHETPFDNRSAIVNRWTVPNGVCGHVSIRVLGKETLRFANWAVKRSRGWDRSRYHGGIFYSVFVGGQSLERKEAFAGAYVETLTRELPELSGHVFVDSRLD